LSLITTIDHVPASQPDLRHPDLALFFKDMTDLAAMTVSVPLAYICGTSEGDSLIAASSGEFAHQILGSWYLGRVALESPGLLQVEDVTTDPRFSDGKPVSSHQNIRFFAGIKIAGSDGIPVASLCVADFHPRRLNPDQEKGLEILARQIAFQLRHRHPVGDFKDHDHSLRRVGGEIPERRVAEERIREQAALLDKAQDAVLVTDLENRITYWNHSAEVLYERPAAEVMGQVANDVLYNEGSIQLKQAIKEFAVEGEWSGELRQRTRSGHEVVVQSRWSTIRDESGTARSILMMNTDNTEKKRLESTFLRAQRMESIGTLAGGIAHDLNNVLAPILMAVQLLRGRVASPRDQRLLDLLENNAQRGAGMIKQVLCFARGVEGERVVLQVRHLANEMQKIVVDTFPCSIQISTKLPKDLWTVMGDATQLHQVLMNLCLNARDAMPGGGQLRIEAENLVLDEHYSRLHPEARPGPYVAVTVKDTGSGIAQNLIDKIFEPFFTTKEIGKGTGLGLSTVLSIVKSHGGFINVYSEVGRGTEFKVHFPASESGTPLQTEGLDEIHSGNGEMILVVDDEVSVREIMKSALEASGYRAVVACDGTEAVALYAQDRHQINLVITDMSMPFLDGPSTIRALQKLNPAIKILAVSGLMAKEKVVEVSGSPNVAFLHKPYTTSKLLAAIQKLLSTSPVQETRN